MEGEENALGDKSRAAVLPISVKTLAISSTTARGIQPALHALILPLPRDNDGVGVWESRFLWKASKNYCSLRGKKLENRSARSKRTAELWTLSDKYKC